MKKCHWILYGFLNFFNNFIVMIILHLFFEATIYDALYGYNWIDNRYMLSTRIEAILILIFIFGIWTSINLLVYKFITRKHKLTNIYLLISMGTMILGIVTGYLIMCR